MADMGLFVYGELCKPDVLRELLGRVPPAEPATLEDHRRRRQGTGHYFHVVPQPGGVVAGLLLSGIEERELAVLDEFENVAAGEYERVEVEVTTLCGQRRSPAWVYR